MSINEKIPNLKAQFQIVVDSMEFDLERFSNLKVTTLPSYQKVVDWVKSRTGLDRTSGITNEIIPKSEYNEIVSNWVARSLKNNMHPTINFLIKDKFCDRISQAVLDHESKSGPQSISTSLTEDNARCVIATIKMIKLYDEQKNQLETMQNRLEVLEMEKADLAQVVENHQSKIARLETQQKEKESNKKIADYFKALNKILLGENANIDEFYSTMETEKREAKIAVGIMGILKPSDYDRRDFIEVLLEKPNHQTLCNKYLAEGFEKDDFVFYQKTILERNRSALVQLPPYVRQGEFKARIEDEIIELSSSTQLVLAEIELKKLLEKLNNKLERNNTTSNM